MEGTTLERLAINIRSAVENDLASIATLFTESIHGIASSSYNQEQLNAWAPHPPDLEQWQLRLSGCTTLVAEIEREPAGFISFTSTGHIEYLFTSPEFSRQGIASELYGVAYNMLRGKGIDKLTTAASLEARPFFERQGFQVIREETVIRSGVVLNRFYMECHCASSASRRHRESLR